MALTLKLKVKSSRKTLVGTATAATPSLFILDRAATWMNTDEFSDLFDLQEQQAEALAYIRKESLDIFNRLHSISEDVSFVNEVHKVYPDIPILRMLYL